MDSSILSIYYQPLYEWKRLHLDGFRLSPLSFLLQSCNFLSFLALCNTETCSDSQLYKGGQQRNCHKLHHVHQKAAARVSRVLGHLIACYKSSWLGITGNIFQFRNLGNFYFQCVTEISIWEEKKTTKKMPFFFFSWSYDSLSQQIYYGVLSCI